jgi:hypothetical protein
VEGAGKRQDHPAASVGVQRLGDSLREGEMVVHGAPSGSGIHHPQLRIGDFDIQDPS